MTKKILGKVYQYTVIFEPAEEGGFNVSVPALPGCFTQGDTFEEALAMAEDAIKCYLRSKIKHRESIPRESKKEFIGIVKIDSNYYTIYLSDRQAGSIIPSKSLGFWTRDQENIFSNSFKNSLTFLRAFSASSLLNSINLS